LLSMPIKAKRNSLNSERGSVNGDGVIDAHRRFL
jgi:hypothetical protein